MTTTPFSIGQRVEVQSPDFSQPGMPLVWWPATITALEPKEGTKLTDVQFQRDDAEHVSMILTGPRGGGKIRPA